MTERYQSAAGKQHDKQMLLAGCAFYQCARRRTSLTGESPESARWWEGYS